MKRLKRSENYTQKLPIKIVQFGDGNFIRGFADYIVDKLNAEADFNAGVAVVKARAGGSIQLLQDQDGLFTLLTKGISQGIPVEHTRIISCIQKAINPYEDYNAYRDLAKEEELIILLSNTTEAGIVFNENDTLLTGHPHQSFPAKVTALLYERFLYFEGDNTKGLTLLPLELIANNGDVLKKIILQYVNLWQLGNAFTTWINEYNYFHNTLVDRIVPGYPKDDVTTYIEKLGYEDTLMTVSETFLFWAIQADEVLLQKILFNAINENILVVKDIEPYRVRKVRILNGAHTLMVPLSLLDGNETVKQSIDNNFIGLFIKEAVYQEINPTINLPETELTIFSDEVFDRFRNPFIHHKLSSIALNSISKFKVRVLPVILDYLAKYNTLPLRLTFAFACLLRFYKGDWNGNTLPIQDDFKIINIFKHAWDADSIDETVSYILSQTLLWDTDLLIVDSLKKQLITALQCLENNGSIEEAFIAYKLITLPK
ncbi:tagaturonate reductase [Flavobacterium subsaxonicum]|uniref:Altronate oxidoreductase n=1 Tax=Flavobacterium subsaxonicum WB 4.1-42 = DSM 21790 TaxID=1121898 RepID=A0A0A2MZH3_9FLAO|nr:tagaturonate reductase [Flavobacterium subsaxonicum]KGO93610.1 altronate oxidoreductase [Flavobacterium subsaxonicum WB 4.1-42 = DSM 21790]